MTTTTFGSDTRRTIPAAAGDDGTLLELKLVGHISGRFFVARYQRGYRWGEHEVRRLLDDLWEHRAKAYSLQPIVVKERGEEWELVDGQQRLTTLYLLLTYMKQTGLQNVGPMYEIRYETREDSANYLRRPDAAECHQNIDYFHIHRAWECIRAWFEALNEGERQYRANKLYDALFENVRVIWYQAPAHLDSATLFTRLNVGRIPLTDAELVKAQLLSQIADRDRPYRASELSAEWDRIERDLRRPDVWAFVTTSVAEDYPTRITLLLDTLADDISGGRGRRTRPRYFTFEVLREQIEKEGPRAVWDRVVDLHGLVLGWYESRTLYHKVGYLVAVGQQFADLVSLAHGCTKSEFEALLDDRIRNSIDLSPAQVSELTYEANYEKCSHVLLLMNAETVRKVVDSSERYPFRRHRERADGEGLCWSLEHIHAQQTEGLTKVEQWKSWLELHRDALIDLPTVDPSRRNALIQKIDDHIDSIERTTFEDLAREITAVFTRSDDASARESVHSIANLALLPGDANSKLNNAVFEVKRRRILELDRSGAYIPICTRRVFLKYYTDAGAQQIHFWGPQDRESYLQAMISPEHGVLFNYLKPEEPR